MLVGRRCGYVSFSQTVNVAAIEYGYRPPKDKVYCSLNIAILIILPAAFPVGIKCVLEAQETAFLEIYPIGTYKAGHGLPYGPGGILKRDIFGVKVGTINVT